MPVDRGAIDQQLRSIGEGAQWWEVRELRDLPVVMHDDERILAIGRGKIARVRWLRRPWLVVVTADRLILLRSFSRTGWRHIEVPTDLVERLSLRTGPFRGRVRLVAAGAAWRILLEREQAYRVHAALAASAAPGRNVVHGLGPGRIVRRMVDHVLALPAVAFTPGAVQSLPAPTSAPADAELEQRVQTLEEQVQELQEQVHFLEQLLRDRQTESLSRGS